MRGSPGALALLVWARLGTAFWTRMDVAQLKSGLRKLRGCLAVKSIRTNPSEVREGKVRWAAVGSEREEVTASPVTDPPWRTSSSS